MKMWSGKWSKLTVDEIEKKINGLGSDRMVKVWLVEPNPSSAGAVGNSEGVWVLSE